MLSDKLPGEGKILAPRLVDPQLTDDLRSEVAQPAGRDGHAARYSADLWRTRGRCEGGPDKIIKTRLTFLSWPLVSRAKSPGNIDQSKVCDDCSPVLQENVFGFEIFVDNAFVVKVTHALCNLLCDDDDFVHVEFIFS